MTTATTTAFPGTTDGPSGGRGAPPPLAVIGNPSSAGSYAAGQDRAPEALRRAGLITALEAAGRAVTDLGDLDAQVWRPDRTAPHAQNVAAVVENLRELRSRLVEPLRSGHQVLVLGGNCTVALAAVAALRDATGQPPALLYIDRHFDSNVPDSSGDGSLDWMGLAHALDLPGAVDELADAFGARPLLSAGQISFLGVELAAATEWERSQAESLPYAYVTSRALAEAPEGAAAQALRALPDAPLAVHLDVDVMDFTDAPLAESTGGRNSGPTLEQLGAALRAAGRHPSRRVVSVGELNPTRSAGDPDAIARFVRLLAGAV